MITILKWIGIITLGSIGFAISATAIMAGALGVKTLLVALIEDGKENK